MGYIFEFYNKEGKMTKRGVVAENKVLLATGDNDFRYVIRSDEYPYNIEREGYFQKSHAVNRQSPLGVLSCVKHDDIEFILNSELAEIEYYINNEQIEFEKRGALIIAPNVPGTHKMVNKKTKEETWFRIKNLKTIDAAKQLSNDMNTENIVNQMLVEYKDKEISLSEMLIDSIKKCEEDQLLHHHRIIDKYQVLYNEMLRHETSSKWKVNSGFDCIIMPENEINRVSIYELQRDQKIFKGSINIKDETKIVIDEYKVHLIEGYKDGRFVSSRLAISIPSRVRTAKWKEDKYNEERLNYLIQKARISSAGIPEEIEEEVFLISSAGIFSARYGTPSITYEKEEIMLEVMDSDLKDKYNEKIYLCLASKKSFVNGEYWIKEEIELPEITINTFDYGIDIEETYFVWIENHLGDKVGDFNILYPFSKFEDLNTIYFDYIVEKERALITEKTININKDHFEKLISDYYFSKGDLANRRMRLEGLIYELYEKGTWDISYTIFDIIYGYLIKDDIVINNFFEENLTFSSWTRRIQIPPTSRNFVAVVYSFEDYTKKITKHILQQPEYIDIDESYAIVQFMDLTENVSSSYVFVSGRNKERPVRLNRGLEIEVI